MSRNQYWTRVILTTVALILCLVTQCRYAKADVLGNFNNLRLLDVDQVSVEYTKIADYRDFFYLEDRKDLKFRAAFRMDLRLLKYGYWNNEFNMLGTETQIRGGGWKFETGIHAGKYLDVFYSHHSQHVFERERPPMGYPLYNMYGFRMIFYSRTKK
jgi:hypothetical protein